MDDKKKNIFRQKSIDSIESPEVLDQYLRVTSPGVWVTFCAVIVLLIGALVWSVLGTIESTTRVAVVLNEEYQCAFVPEEALQTVIAEREMTVEGEKIALAPKSIEPVVVTDAWDVYIMLAGDLSAGDIVYPIPLQAVEQPGAAGADGQFPLEEGIYTGTIVTETISPISFLLN